MTCTDLKIRRADCSSQCVLTAHIALAAIVPAHGNEMPAVEHGSTLAVALLFLLYGARLAPQAIWAGLAHWRRPRRVFACALLAQRHARRSAA